MSVYTLKHNIKIGQYTVNKVTSVEITKTLESFTNTAVITMPKRLLYNNQPVFSDFDSLLFKRGDQVSINLTYIHEANIFQTKNQFNGFISEIECTDFEVMIVCEDYMFFAKKTKLNFVAPTISLQDLSTKLVTAINAILPAGLQKVKINTDGISLNLINFKAEQASVVEILQLLKESYILDSYFIDNILYIGINFSSINSRAKSDFTFTTYPRDIVAKNSKDTFLLLIDTGNLKYKKAEDMKFSITAKVFSSNSTYKEIKSGDSDGEQRTFLFYGDYSSTQIQALVDNQIQRLKYDGFQRGSSFTTFGLPTIEILTLVSFDGIGLIRYYDNQIYKQTKLKRVYEKSTYLVDSVKITYNSGGFRQEVGISNRVNVQSDSNSIAAKIEGLANLIKF